MDSPVTGIRQSLFPGYDPMLKETGNRIDSMLTEVLLDYFPHTLQQKSKILLGQYQKVVNLGKVIGYSKRLCICESCVCRSLPTRAERVLTACSLKRKGIIRKEL